MQSVPGVPCHETVPAYSRFCGHAEDVEPLLRELEQDLAKVKRKTGVDVETDGEAS